MLKQSPAQHEMQCKLEKNGQFNVMGMTQISRVVIMHGVIFPPKKTSHVLIAFNEYFISEF